jgi:hypothetical protein
MVRVAAFDALGAVAPLLYEGAAASWRVGRAADNGRSVANTPFVLPTLHVANGLCLHARTALPTWRGERFNLAYAVDVLHPLAARPSDVRE